MTHGKQWYRNKLKIQNEEGFEAHSNPEVGCPNRMSKKEAVAYYNAKIFKFWLSMFDVTLPQTKREEITSYPMFKNPIKYKELTI